LTGLLKFPVWHSTTILEVIDEEGVPPDHVFRQDTLRIKEWLEARELRRRLDAASNAASGGDA
jgi:hypothetical protein